MALSEPEPVAWRIRTARPDGSWGSWWITEDAPDEDELAEGYGYEIVALGPVGEARVVGDILAKSASNPAGEQFAESAKCSLHHARDEESHGTP